MWPRQHQRLVDISCARKSRQSARRWATENQSIRSWEHERSRVPRHVKARFCCDVFVHTHSPPEGELTAPHSNVDAAIGPASHEERYKYNSCATHTIAQRNMFSLKATCSRLPSPRLDKKPRLFKETARNNTCTLARTRYSPRTSWPGFCGRGLQRWFKEQSLCNDATTRCGAIASDVPRWQQQRLLRTATTAHALAAAVQEGGLNCECRKLL